ncbi:hypothetical protein B0H66DRAFT_535925 [Apodospora peruviana]|uniref:Uncharacterized protein n=1 Tax=Apodospora peruviana TaxID=516989 RepID=A0AAE0M1X2_9PEZI|nr:hypothetical protein B0H66DRAFT_535925 [Apodospora peruviana]
MYGSYYSCSSSSSHSSSSSYTSYASSYGSMATPMDIAPSPFSSRGPDASCAFPSWPRRTSLSESDAAEERATSYLSDEDLFPQDVFEDDARSVSSNGSASPLQSPTPMPVMTEAELLEVQRERAAYQKEVMRFLMSEKERRRQAAKRSRSSSGSKSSSSSKQKSPKSKLSAMTPIAEAE